jgi:hypothetical protein
MNEFNSTADILIDRLRNLADGKTTVYLFDEISRAAMDMISNVFKKAYKFFCNSIKF